MRKLMLMAAMLAMVLVAAAPAFAQATGGDVSIQAVDCSQVAAVTAVQGQYGDATAVSGDVGSAASASIANELGVSVEQVNACLGGVAAGDDIVADDDDVVVHEDDGVAQEDDVVHADDNGAAHEDGGSMSSGSSGGSSSGGSASGGSSSAGTASAGAAPAMTVLPDTGGASLIALGAGALLVAGGLVARKVVR